MKLKTACVYHSIDLDGWMSAAIVKHWWINNNGGIITKNNLTNGIKNGNTLIPLNYLDFLGFNYGDPIPDLSNYDKVIICDISLPKEEMEKIAWKTIWIDHHISTINDNIKIFDYNYTSGRRDTNFAACELTWQYFFPNETIPEIIRLLGRYDCFGYKGTDEEQFVLKFQYGARSIITNYQEAFEQLKISIASYNINNQNENYIYRLGIPIYDYLCIDAKQSYKNGFELNFFSHTANNNIDNIPKTNFKFICINKERFNPINFGIDYHKDGYDGCACFYFDGRMYNFSLYNDNGLVDCSMIAKQFGGGGHKGASGFRIKSLTEIRL